MVQLYRGVYLPPIKVDSLEDQKDRLTNGLEKLRRTQEDVAALEDVLKEKAASSCI